MYPMVTDGEETLRRDVRQGDEEEAPPEGPEIHGGEVQGDGGSGVPVVGASQGVGYFSHVGVVDHEGEEQQPGG